MAYQRFKIPEMETPPATVATVATLPANQGRTVASVATVARVKLDSAPQSVATVATVAGHKPENENSQPDPDAIRDAYEERAAILEYDAGLSRAEAERQAAEETGHALPKSDAEMYADALRQIAPCGYGPVAVFLGWGAGRSSAAETELRQAGRIVYDRTGRGRLVNI